jgi:glycosyltransferase involved in cell wall biosynthesis
MRVSFPNIPKEQDNVIQTGKGNFIGRLIPELEKLGVSCVRMEDKSDIKFHLISYDPSEYGRYKNIVRLDGVHIGKGQSNDKLSLSHSQADGIIYQSGFSKRCCDTFLNKPKPGAVTDIICNGASPSYYESIDPINLPFKYNIFCSSRRGLPHKRIPETISIFKRIKREDISLIIAGDVPSKDSHPRIIYTGQLTNRELGKYYKSCDMMLFLSWIDNCPNTVVEALCSGLFCVVSNEGGTNELINDYIGKVFNVDPPFPYVQVDYNNPPKISDMNKDNIDNYIEENIESISKLNIKFNNKNVRIENVAKKYKKIFEEVLK